MCEVYEGLLAELMRNPRRVVTRTMLLERVWDFDFDPKTNIVDTHMSRLRSKLNAGFEEDAKGYIRRAETPAEPKGPVVTQNVSFGRPVTSVLANHPGLDGGEAAVQYYLTGTVAHQLSACFSSSTNVGPMGRRFIRLHSFATVGFCEKQHINVPDAVIARRLPRARLLGRRAE